jgi:capsular polysaccharide transport system permease protein
MTPSAEDRPKRRRELRAVAPEPAPDQGPWPDDAIAPDQGPEPDPEAAGEERKKRRRRRRRRRGRGDAADAVTAPAPLPARARPRHWGALAGFLALVLLPFAAATGYLFLRAAPQYHSEVAFSVRSEEATSATAGLLGALTQVGGGTAPDAAILYEYIRSQEIVDAVDARLDLRAIWNRPGGGWRDGDPVFTLGDDETIEALHRQWLRMVTVSYDTAAGIIDVVVRAFTPEEAHAIAEAILAESSALVNELAEQAREDAVRFAREELAEAEANLAEVRSRLAGFRREHSLVDPSADVAGQSGLLNALNAELAQALVDRDVLTSYAGEGDQRVVQADRRITAITERIEDERATLGVTGVAGTLPEVVGRFEELSLDLEFANQAYTQALAGLAAARAEARRQSRYLAPHVRPTLASTALYPRRFLLAGLAGLFLLLGWGTLMLVYYNVRDNR